MNLLLLVLLWPLSTTQSKSSLEHRKHGWAGLRLALHFTWRGVNQVPGKGRVLYIKAGYQLLAKSDLRAAVWIGTD